MDCCDERLLRGIKRVDPVTAHARLAELSRSARGRKCFHVCAGTECPIAGAMNNNHAYVGMFIRFAQRSRQLLTHLVIDRV
jgi:hypothetical protein